MSKLEIINEILDPKYKSSNQVSLIENGQSGGKKFEMNYNIISGKIEYSLFRLDPNQLDFFPYFTNESGLKKICDYFLFAEHENYLYVFLIEMKKSPKSARKQLVASKIFIEFVIKSAQRIGKEIDDKIAIRLIRICDSKICKKRATKEETINFDSDGYID